MRRSRLEEGETRCRGEVVQHASTDGSGGCAGGAYQTVKQKVLRVIEGPANSERAHRIGDLNRIGDRAFRLGVVSAAGLESVQRDLERPALAGFAGQLAFIVGDADPKRTAFTELAGGRPRDFVYVGDTEYDIREARAAGVRSIGYAGGYRPAGALREAGAESIIDRLSDLPALLNEIAAAPLAAGSDGSR